MAFPVASRKADFVSAPRASQTAGPPGQVLAVTVSTTADYINLSLGISQAARDMSIANSDITSMTRNYLAIECDVDLGIIFGSTAAMVTTTNVPQISTVGTLSAGVYTPAVKTCFVIYAKIPMRFMTQAGVDLFLGFVASGAGTMRLYQMSSDQA